MKCLPLLAVLVSGILCQYEDYDSPVYHYPYYPDAGFDSLSMPSVQGCSAECSCPSSSAMYCDNRKLTAIPPIPPNVKYLYLQNNMLTEIKDGAFDNATELAWLVLDYNDITNGKIGRNTFNKLKNLERLYFTHNNLTEPVGPLPKTLTELRLNNNKLSKISANAFEGLENLTTLHLQENELKDVPGANVFKGLKSLVQLDISHNKLKKLPSGLPPTLLEFYADHNSITNVPDEYFQRFISLQYLRLSYNQISDAGIPGNVFNISSLLELDLSFNQLKNIPTVSENLENLYLQSNQISKISMSSFCKVVSPMDFSKLRHLRLDANNLTRESLPIDVNNCLRQASEIILD
ncbi:lumican [Protopterus annectens]|uniref:lumican n=1 Tax=Protopterus annectens TaxID=7888 RepID=UPI001CF98EB6|nr:lumican [Protopterus annectens]XP_043943791.1 lumican [Protopterus annectens]